MHTEGERHHTCFRDDAHNVYFLVVKGLEDARVDVILGERLDLSSISGAKSALTRTDG